MTRNKGAVINRLTRRSHLFVGALAGAVGVIAVMPFFYPLGRLFDPTVGGDPPASLPTELVLGFIGGVLLSPIAGLVGSAVAVLLKGRRIGPLAGLALTAVASTLAIGLWAALNGGIADEGGSLKSVQWAATLGALAGAMALATYTTARNVLAAKLTAVAASEQRTSPSP